MGSVSGVRGGTRKLLVVSSNLAYLRLVPDWLARLLPPSIASFVAHLAATNVLYWIAGISGVALLASVVGVPLLLARLPADYFTGREGRRAMATPRSPGRTALKILKNALGVTLLVLGLLMLVLPGQGILTIVVALLLVDFPGKYRLERWLMGRPSVLGAINALRRRMNCEPFEERASWMPPPVSPKKSSRRSS